MLSVGNAKRQAFLLGRPWASMGLARVASLGRSSKPRNSATPPPPLHSVIKVLTSVLMCQGGQCLHLRGQRTGPKLPSELPSGRGSIILVIVCSLPIPACPTVSRVTQGSSNRISKEACLFSNGDTKVEEALVRAARMINDGNQDVEWRLKGSLSVSCSASSSLSRGHLVTRPPTLAGLQPACCRSPSSPQMGSSCIGEKTGGGGCGGGDGCGSGAVSGPVYPGGCVVDCRRQPCCLTVISFFSDSVSFSANQQGCCAEV